MIGNKAKILGLEKDVAVLKTEVENLKKMVEFLSSSIVSKKDFDFTIK